MTAGGRGREGRRRHPRELERILSKAGLCSRTEARAWITSGRVRVNGAVIVDPVAWFDPEWDRITVDGRSLAAEQSLVFALHKPRGFITTHGDPMGRPTVYDLVKDIGAWVSPVGRLDLDSSGLLLLTNDTSLADSVTSPRSHLAKVYRVEAAPRLEAAALDALACGVELSDGPTRPAKVRRLFDSGSRTVFEITLTEGRNRQVRRMVRAVGGRVEKLERTAIGPIQLGSLESGKWRALTRAEVGALEKLARSPKR